MRVRKLSKFFDILRTVCVGYITLRQVCSHLPFVCAYASAYESVCVSNVNLALCNNFIIKYTWPWSRCTHIIFAITQIIGELQRIINIYHQLIVTYCFLFARLCLCLLQFRLKSNSFDFIREL